MQTHLLPQDAMYPFHRSIGFNRASAIVALSLLTTVLFLNPSLAQKRSKSGLAKSSAASRTRRMELYWQTLSQRQLREVKRAMIQYEIEHEGALPTLDTPKSLAKQLDSYRFVPSNLVCPHASDSYRMNKGLSGKKRKDLKNPANILVLWSPRPLSDGGYIVLDARYYDRKVSASEFAKMKSASHIA